MKIPSTEEIWKGNEERIEGTGINLRRKIDSHRQNISNVDSVDLLGLQTSGTDGCLSRSCLELCGCGIFKRTAECTKCSSLGADDEDSYKLIQ